MLARILVAGAMVLAVATAAPAEQHNLQIFRNVQRQVLQYPHFTVFDSVNAQINNGVLTLTGKVTMPYKRDDIEKRVAKVNGIAKVVNKIDVLPASGFDDDLRYGIAQAIYANPAFSNYAAAANPPIHIIVDRGHVTLEGVVNNDVDRALARSIASSFDAFEVKNQLKTDREVQQELEKL